MLSSGGYVGLVLTEGRTDIYWYNPKIRSTEDRPAPETNEEAVSLLAGDINSEAFLSEYNRLRESGMGIEQALIFTGHKFRLRQLEYQPRS